MPTSLPDFQYPMHAIVAMAANRVIGRDGKLPWHLPEDLKLFKKLTMGHPIIMGRGTWESLGKPLPGRENIVVSSKLSEANSPDSVTIAPDLESLAALPMKNDVFLIGGAQLFAALLPACSSLYLTLIYDSYEGDARMPAFEEEFSLEKVLVQTDQFEQRLYLRNTTT